MLIAARRTADLEVVTYGFPHSTAGRPRGDQAAEREEKTKGGIFLPDTASKERPRKARSWPSARAGSTTTASASPMDVKAGDKVLFAKYCGTEYKVDDVEYLILAEKDILAIVQRVSTATAMS